jgi:hypothetical protein
MRQHSIPALFLALAIAVYAALVQAQDKMRVGEIGGYWYLESAAAISLSAWQEVPAGGVIRPKSPSAESHILIVYPDGTIVDKRDCASMNLCIKPIYLPRKVELQGDPTLWNAAAAIMSNAADILLDREHGRPEFYRSRGSELSEAVVKLVGGGLDLTPVFAKMKKGRYVLRMLVIPPDADRGNEASIFGPLVYVWDPDRPILPVTQLGPGLYEVALLEASGGEYESTGIATCALLANASEYQDKAGSFDNALALTRKWGAEARPETKHAFLCAYLHHLASHP